MGNLQMLLEIGLFKRKKRNKKINQKCCIKSGLPNSYFFNKRCNVLL